MLTHLQPSWFDPDDTVLSVAASIGGFHREGSFIVVFPVGRLTEVSDGGEVIQVSQPWDHVSSWRERGITLD